MKLELDIFYHNDHTTALYNADVDYKLADTDIREFTFYRIDAIAPYYEDGIEYSIVFSGGETFNSPLTYQELKQKVDEAI